MLPEKRMEQISTASSSCPMNKWGRRICSEVCGSDRMKPKQAMIVKMVDRRFQVWQWSVGEDVEYSFVTYDSDAEKYRWWGVLADGFIMEWSGRRYWRNLLEWETVKLPEEGLAMTIRETRITEDRKKLEMTGTMKQGDEVVAYRKDEFTWLSELPEEHRLSEVK